MTYGPYAEWLANLPADVAELARRWPMVQESGELLCYRSRRNGDAHYTIHAYTLDDLDRPYCTVVHGADSFLPGIGAFGMPLAELGRCGCGRWAFASAAQLEWSQARIRRRARQQGEGKAKQTKRPLIDASGKPLPVEAAAVSTALMDAIRHGLEDAGDKPQGGAGA